MADIKEFRGLRYNMRYVDDLSLVVAPPYDVISPEGQERYYQMHPYNIIRLILGRQYPEDTDTENRYTRSATCFREWQEGGILVPDSEPGLYSYVIDYEVEGCAPCRRMGLIALVRLEDLTEGSIRRHEKTFSETKSDRFKLMQACRANLCPIFSVYSDPEARVTKLLEETRGPSPDAEFRDRDGIRHRLWRVTDTDAIRLVQEWFRGRELFIADGHHRYETAVAFWQHVQATEDISGEGHPVQYVMMYLCNASEPLTILPVHRLLTAWPAHLSKEGFLKEAAEVMDVERFEFGGDLCPETLGRLASAMNEGGRRTHTFGFCFQHDRSVSLLGLKPHIMEEIFGESIPKPLQGLDVVVLTELVLKRILGIRDEDLDNEHALRYSSRMAEALQAVEVGKSAACFLMNPTRIDQVMEVAEEGLIMPRKSTYFYPKVISGLVINRL